jgi:hypothetical protein
MSLPLLTLTIGHVLISLLAIASGFVVARGFLRSKRDDVWTAIFLVMTAATSVTGFFFPAEKLLPSHVLGILSLVLLPIALVARYRRRLLGSWRWVFVITSMVLLYLNVFVLIVQLFLKVPALAALAPTQSELPFVAAQLATLSLFIGLTTLAVRRFRVPSNDLGPTKVDSLACQL